MATTKPTKTRRAKRTGKTPEQRTAEAKALHETLTAKVEALTETAEWMRFLDFSCSFHAYSLSNVLLILAQRPNATTVAGFRQWQGKGRQVRKGEHGIRIFGYSTRKVTEEDPDTGEETTRRVPRFPVLTVFDISQTDPIEGAETVEHPASILTGTAPHGVWEAIATWLETEGWSVTREAISGAMTGYTDPVGRRVVVRDDVDDAQAVKTLIHEAAHVVLHTELKAGEYVAHRGIWETEAESVAYVVAGIAGQDTSANSVGYVAAWTAGDVDVLRNTASRVLEAVHTIANVLTADHEPTGKEAAADAAA